MNKIFPRIKEERYGDIELTTYYLLSSPIQITVCSTKNVYEDNVFHLFKNYTCGGIYIKITKKKGMVPITYIGETNSFERRMQEHTKDKYQFDTSISTYYIIHSPLSPILADYSDNRKWLEHRLALLYNHCGHLIEAQTSNCPASDKSEMEIVLNHIMNILKYQNCGILIPEDMTTEKVLSLTKFVDPPIVKDGETYILLYNGKEQNVEMTYIDKNLYILRKGSVISETVSDNKYHVDFIRKRDEYRKKGYLDGTKVIKDIPLESRYALLCLINGVSANTKSSKWVNKQTGMEHKLPQSDRDYQEKAPRKKK